MLQLTGWSCLRKCRNHQPQSWFHFPSFQLSFLQSTFPGTVLKIFRHKQYSHIQSHQGNFRSTAENWEDCKSTEAARTSQMLLSRKHCKNIPVLLQLQSYILLSSCAYRGTMSPVPLLFSLCYQVAPRGNIRNHPKSSVTPNTPVSNWSSCQLTKYCKKQLKKSTVLTLTTHLNCTCIEIKMHLIITVTCL